ncbi:MAG: PQQ-binding-like beta-propeller repeat protein [Verrucomicrobia bacterium]|nr:PQQ-binding-like beta-propeller repeat protein [Verrucomicrobiota bacterium]
MRTWITLVAAMSAWVATTASAMDVTVTLVAADEQGRTRPIEERQRLWMSPFGGCVVTVWPFIIRLDGTPIMEYLTASQKIEAKAMAGGVQRTDSKLESMLNETFMPENVVRAEDLTVFDSRRPTSQTVQLSKGRHVIQPFGIEFTLTEDGTVASSDARLRVHAKTRRLDVVCSPVTFKLLREKRSVSGPLRLSYNSTTLVGGLQQMLAAYDEKNWRAVGTSMKSGLRRVTVYLPSSAAGNSYEANGVKFELDAEGRVKLAADAKASSDDGHTVRIILPAARPAAVRAKNPIGVSWFDGPGEVKVTCGSESVIVNPGLKMTTGSAIGEGRSGSASLAPSMPRGGNVQVGGLSARLPVPDEQWPHRHVICGLADGVAWAVETAPLETKPGAAWSCRITAAAGKAAIPAALKVTLESAGGGAAGGEMELKNADGVLTGTLPSKPGLWRLRVAATDGSPLRGQTLGVVLIGDKPTAAVSLFTVNNRALFRRGDTFDLLWAARQSAGAAAAEWPVRLRGMGLDAVVARIAVPADGGSSADVSGRLVVDTAALGAGEYTAAVEADGVAGYPFRFRICQREPLSDFDLYSFGIHTTGAPLYPGSPINSYVGSPAGGPGLEPFLADGDGALDGVFGAYADTPLGPLPEMFARPSMEERNGMASAVMGLHNAPGWPEAHSYEIMNPKHTLPENLAWVRRRMALYAQTHADYPGVDGFDYGWNWQVNEKGYWSDSGPRLDAWQPEAGRQGEAAAWKLTQKMWPKVVAKYAHLKPLRTTPPDKWPKELADIPGLTEAQMRYVNAVEPHGWSMRLPNTFKEWYADLVEIMPRLTHHSHVSSPGVGNGIQNSEWHGKTHRSSVDYSEHMQSPFDEWRAPTIMAMDNREKQKIQLAIANHGYRSEVITSLFAAAGRGADGFAISGFTEGHDGIGRVFERFGSWFVSYDPLPDVALFWSRNGNAVRTAIHDLARIRRPAIMVGPRDVEAGELLKYKVLLLLSVGDELPPETLQAFRDFEAKGGVILKDDACHKNVPGRSLGMAYTGENVSGMWGGAQAGGPWEHDYLWEIFLKKQDTLNKAFADTPQPPVTTPDTDVLLSPLAGKDAIICFVINKTMIPLSVTFGAQTSNKFRQSWVLPKIGELQVAKGWHVRNLLTGKAAPVESTAKGLRVPLRLTGAEGEIYLLTRRKPEGMIINVDRTSQVNARLTGGLADGEGKLLADPMPFEVTLKGPDGATLLHTFASIGPTHPFDLAVPAMSGGAKPELVVRDLVLGTTAVQALEPAAPAAAAVRQTPDLIGGEKKIMAFLSERKNKGPVTIILDQGQDAYRPAAEKLAALLKKSGREASVTTFDPADIRKLHLRWYPQPEDLEVLHSVTNDSAWAWRVDMSVWAAFERDEFGTIVKVDYASPACGYAEAGPRLRHDADVILFGTPADNHVVADIAPWLRRKPTDNYPVPGGFFVHYLWSPFRAAYDAVYVGCRDVAGAEAAVACIASLKAPEPVQMAKPAAKPLTIRGGRPAPLEDMQKLMGGAYVLNLEYSPSGNRLFAATFAHGDWLFMMDSDGKVLEHLMPPETKVWPSWYLWGRWASPLSDTLLRVHLWDAMYQYEVGRGWINKAAKASTVEDKQAGRAFLGGSDRLRALDPNGRVLWTYEDGRVSSDLTVVREVSPRALSGDKRVLLVSAFVKGRNQLIAPSVIGLDAATGEVLWNHNGIPLSSGKIVSLADRFMVIDDNGGAHELIAATGRRGKAMSALTGSPDWVLELPGQRLLIAENSHWTRSGPACRVYFRSLAGRPDKDLKVSGRVSQIGVAPDKQSFVVATSDRRLLWFSVDGALLWQKEVPLSNIVRVSPDGKTVAAGGQDGVVRLFDAADGKLRSETDLSRYNVIAADEYTNQKRMRDLPMEKGLTPQPPPPEPSYLKSIPKNALTFGPNLAPPEKMRALLQPAGNVTIVGEKPGYLGRLTEAVQLPPFKVKAGTTYLVELLDVVGAPIDTASVLRLEISVAGSREAKNLPCTVKLPVASDLKRRRFAFRADQNDEVTLTMRPIVMDERREIDGVEIGKIPIVVGDLVVSAMQFPGKNVLFDGGPGSNTEPYGTFDCTLYALPDGVSATREIDTKHPDVGLRLVNGTIANHKTDWDSIARKEGVVAYAVAATHFDRPCELSAVGVYEDISGPVFKSDSVRERSATRYSVEVHKLKGGWVRVGTVIDNTQLVNIFPCPEGQIDGIRYVWAGRYDDMTRNRTDGYVRTAQIEAYMSADDIDMKELLDVESDSDLNIMDF